MKLCVTQQRGEYHANDELGHDRMLRPFKTLRDEAVCHSQRGQCYANDELGCDIRTLKTLIVILHM